MAAETFGAPGRVIFREARNAGVMGDDMMLTGVTSVELNKNKSLHMVLESFFF